MINVSDEVSRFFNRHIARVLCNLEEAGCPEVFKQAVKSSMIMTRGEVLDAQDTAIETGLIIERRKRELIADLTGAACNQCFVRAVKSEFEWLAKDVCETIAGVMEGEK